MPKQTIYNMTIIVKVVEISSIFENLSQKKHSKKYQTANRFPCAVEESPFSKLV